MSPSLILSPPRLSLQVVRRRGCVCTEVLCFGSSRRDIVDSVRASVPYPAERPTDKFYQHLMSSCGVGYNGRVNRLFTLTAVCPEAQWGEQQAALRAILDTFELPPTLYK